MHITHALGQRPSGGRRLAGATLVGAFCITLALAVGGTASASAAGPDALAPGQSVWYPTWFFGSTRVCATNDEVQPGMADVRPAASLPGGQHDEIYVPPYSERCIDRWWWANPIEVSNLSNTTLGTNPVLTARTE
jgi:hypothetical protein